MFRALADVQRVGIFSAIVLVAGCGSTAPPSASPTLPLATEPPATQPRVTDAPATQPLETPPPTTTLPDKPSPLPASTPSPTASPPELGIRHPWQEVRLTDTGDRYARDFLTIGTSTAIAAVDRGRSGGVFIHRSTDSGTTWQVIELSATGTDPSIDGRGNDVDAVWIDRELQEVVYAHSSNGGASFGDAQTIVAVSRGYASNPSVARAQDGLVMVAWMHDTIRSDEGYTGLRIKVSADGGATFGESYLIDRGRWPGFQTVAAGDGVLYLAYVIYNPSRAHVMRSFDNGATWSGSLDLELPDLFGWGITASGTEAYVSFSEGGLATSYRTDNLGASWSFHVLSEEEQEPAGSPVIAIDDGLYAAYAGSSELVFQSSFDGLAWSAPETFWKAPEDQVFEPIGVGFAGRALVLYQAGTWNQSGRLDVDVYVAARAT